MKTLLQTVSMVLLALLVISLQPVAVAEAAPVSIDLTVVGGGGTLSNTSTCEATLDCSDGAHDVAAGVPGQSLGSIDGADVGGGHQHDVFQ